MRPPVSSLLAENRLMNALCGAFMLPLSLSSQARLVCSRSAKLDLATALLLRWNPASTCSGAYCGSHLASSGSSAPVSVSVRPSRCSDHPVQEMEPVVLHQFSAMCVWQYCISAGTLTFMCCCCEPSVPCRTFLDVRQLQRSLQRVGRSCRYTAPGESRFSAH